MMANDKKNSELKYVRWNTIIAFMAIIASVIVSIYTINHQKEFWEYQNKIKKEEQLNQIKIDKIEKVRISFLRFKKLSISAYFKMATFCDLAENINKDIANKLFDNSLDLINQLDELKLDVIYNLETLNSVFSDDIEKDAREISELVINFDLSESNFFDDYSKFKTEIKKKDTNKKNFLELRKKLFLDKDFYEITTKFNSLIEKMYTEIESNLKDI